MRIISKKITGFFKKMPRAIAERAFLASLGFIFLALILGGVVFYRSCILVEKVEPEIKEPPVQFDEKLCQEVLSEQQKEEERFKEADTKEYPNLFQRQISSKPSK